MYQLQSIIHPLNSNAPMHAPVTFSSPLVKWILQLDLPFLTAVSLPHNQLRITVIKVYLNYKMITSENVPSKAHIKDFFISQKNYVPFSRYWSFCIFNHRMIYQISDIMMSISTWDKVHFWIYLLNHKSWSHQTWPVDRYKQVQ